MKESPLPLLGVTGVRISLSPRHRSLGAAQLARRLLRWKPPCIFLLQRRGLSTGGCLLTAPRQGAVDCPRYKRTARGSSLGRVRFRPSLGRRGASVSQPSALRLWARCHAEALGMFIGFHTRFAPWGGEATSRGPDPTGPGLPFARKWPRFTPAGSGLVVRTVDWPRKGREAMLSPACQTVSVLCAETATPGPRLAQHLPHAEIYSCSPTCIAARARRMPLAASRRAGPCCDSRGESRAVGGSGGLVGVQPWGWRRGGKATAHPEVACPWMQSFYVLHLWRQPQGSRCLPAGAARRRWRGWRAFLLVAGPEG